MLRRDQEEASERVLARTAKKCPGCTRYIEKNRGCDHMTCEFWVALFFFLLAVCFPGGFDGECAEKEDADGVCRYEVQIPVLLAMSGSV